MGVLSLIKKSYRLTRGVVATTLMVSVIPTCWLAHSGCRVISIILPRKCWFDMDDFIWASYQKLILFFFEHMTGAEIILSGDIPPEKENVILICNHQCTMDWIVTDIVAVRKNMIGNLRYVFKNAIKYLPFYGYAFGAHGGVFVKRDGSYNDMNMKKVLKKYIDNNVDMCFVIFPEGTRFSLKRKELLAKSQAYAIANDLRPLNQVLTPRIKAFYSALTSMRGYVAAVYDVTIIYEDRSYPSEAGVRIPAPNMWKFLVSPAPQIYIKFHRTSVTDIPTSSMKSTFSWLHRQFEIKDLLIQRHFGLKYGPESDKVVAGVIATNGKGLDSISKDDDLRQGALSSLPLTATLPSLILLTGVTAALLSNRTGRMIYTFALVTGGPIGIGCAKIFY